MEQTNSLVVTASLDMDAGVEAQVGAVLRGRYELKEFLGSFATPGYSFPVIQRRSFAPNTMSHLGQGSFGDAWKAYDNTLNKYVAVKIFYVTSKTKVKTYITWKTATKQQQQELRENAEECTLVKSIMKHKDIHVGSSRICECYSDHVTDAKGTYRPVFLVQEMCGKSLEQVLTESHNTRSGNVQKGRLWVKQLLEGVAFLNMFNPVLIHHDLKPANVVIDGDDLKIIDYGGMTMATTSNRNKFQAQTPTYTPPECSRGVPSFAMPAHSYDVYAVGLMYMELICPSIKWHNWFDQARSMTYALPRSSVDGLLKGNCPNLRYDSNVTDDIDLISLMLSTTPSSRPHPIKALEHRALADTAYRRSPSSIRQAYTRDDHVEYLSQSGMGWLPGKIGAVYAAGFDDGSTSIQGYLYDVLNSDGSIMKQGVREDLLRKRTSAATTIDPSKLVHHHDDGNKKNGGGSRGAAAKLVAARRALRARGRAAKLLARELVGARGKSPRKERRIRPDPDDQKQQALNDFSFKELGCWEGNSQKTGCASYADVGYTCSGTLGWCAYAGNQTDCRGDCENCATFYADRSFYAPMGRCTTYGGATL